MPFSVAYDRILERCGLEGTGLTFQTRVSQIGSELAAAISPMILPQILEDSQWTPTLSLGLWYLVAADFTECLAREPGSQDIVTLGDVRIEPFRPDSDRLRQLGWELLRPFIRPDTLPHISRVRPAARISVQANGELEA